jgi:hypothetical protein
VDNDTAQAEIQDIQISQGSGLLDIRGAGALVTFGNIRHLGTGNLSMQASQFISMAVSSVIRSQGGALSMIAEELELARVESFGTSTLLRSTVFGIITKPGYSGVHVAGDHRVRMELPSGRSISGISQQTGVDVYNVVSQALVTTFNAGTTINYPMP